MEFSLFFSLLGSNILQSMLFLHTQYVFFLFKIKVVVSHAYKTVRRITMLYILITFILPLACITWTQLPFWTAKQRFCTLTNIPVYFSITVTEDKVEYSMCILFPRAHLKQFRCEQIFVLCARCVLILFCDLGRCELLRKGYFEGRHVKSMLPEFV